MDITIKKNDWIFLLICLGLGLLAEISFLHGRIGVSYLVFISGFYIVVFLRFRLTFHHRRIGLLLMGVIWILSGTFLFYDNDFFHYLNIIVIPILVLSHIIIITRPNTFIWETPHFIVTFFTKINHGIIYSSKFLKKSIQFLFKDASEQTVQTIKKIVIGLIIGLPLLLIITGLLMSADAMFENTVLRLPEMIVQLNFLEYIFRFVFVLFSGLLFFGVFQVLRKQSIDEKQYLVAKQKNPHWDSVTVVTILILLNAVYILFVSIQFKYFFSEQLMEGFTYAEYAKRGFYELILVTLINWTYLFIVLGRIKQHSKSMKWIINILHSLIIMESGIMLASAFQRLSMYESAYGFTFSRFIAHAFMVFLMIIFLYTFIRIWVERISLIHFYLILGLIFYTILNVFHIEQFIVDKNIERYEETGKIDIYYLSSLSYTGWSGLITLHELGEKDSELEELLLEMETWLQSDYRNAWQSYNISKEKFIKQYRKLQSSNPDSQEASR